MKTLKQRLLDLLGLTTKEDTAQELHDLLDDYKESIAVRLEREFIFSDLDTKELIASDCFITPPMKGEFYATSKGIYEVLYVTHSYNSSREAGRIQVRKVREFKTAG
ncbi:hypothetical protein [Chryseobacterium sp. SIMBA_028]|uniref:hypothetical protein n=1 Tax=Chryseobacterium sp. SIMBA_028 TaxID=3085771 RepID=UPI0039783A03